MSGQHTQGRLKVQHPHSGERGWEVAFEPGLEQVCQNVTEKNARRLVACWNALDGISTTEIEAAARSGSIAQALERLIAQRDELLAALNLLKAADFGANVKTAEDEKHMDGVAAFARAAIAKAEGGAA